MVIEISTLTRAVWCDVCGAQLFDDIVCCAITVIHTLCLAVSKLFGTAMAHVSRFACYFSASIIQILKFTPQSDMKN